MGGEGISVRHIAIESVSFGNDGGAFTSNSNPSIIIRNSTSINFSGNTVANMDIRGNAGDTVDGVEINSIARRGSGSSASDDDNLINIPPDGFLSILYEPTDPNVAERSLDGFDGYQGRMFLRRKPDGRPDLGTVYKSTVPGKGAWALYD